MYKVFHKFVPTAPGALNERYGKDRLLATFRSGTHAWQWAEAHARSTGDIIRVEVIDTTGKNDPSYFGVGCMGGTIQKEKLSA